MPHRPLPIDAHAPDTTSPIFPLRAGLLFAALIFGSVSQAHAQGAAGLDAPTQTSSGDSIVSVELFAGTTAPIDVHLGARLVFFKRLFLTASGGRTVYGSVLGPIVGQIGGDNAAAIVEPIFSNGWTFRLGAGIRPFGASGPELVAGYAYLGASASWNTAAFGLPDTGIALDASARLDMVFAELGWTIPLGPLFFRPAVGWTQVLGANVSIATEAQLGRDNIATAATEAEDIIETYGRTPTFSLGLGARF